MLQTYKVDGVPIQTRKKVLTFVQYVKMRKKIYLNKILGTKLTILSIWKYSYSMQETDNESCSLA